MTPHTKEATAVCDVTHMGQDSYVYNDSSHITVAGS